MFLTANAGDALRLRANLEPSLSDVAKRGPLARMLGAAILKADVYEEVEADPRATAQAALVVLVVSLATAVQDYELGWWPMAAAGVTSLLQWLLWAGITWLIGTRVFRGTATWGELLRTLGFARTPGLLIVLAPVVGGIGFALQAWMLAAGVVAIRQALDFGTRKAVLTALLGVVPYWIVLALVLH